MPLILGTNSIKDTGYDVANSLRFDGSSSTLTRTPSSETNRKTFTISSWVKFSATESMLFSVGADTNNRSYIILTSDAIVIENRDSGTKNVLLITNRLFRDYSAWYHILLSVDTTQSTASDRVKLYVNGVQETSFSTETYPSQNQLWDFTKTNTHYIGRNAWSSGNFMNGYLAEFVYIDGEQLDPTSFGEFDSDSPTIWKPIDVSGLTFGTNGFYLDFENSGALGADVSGNSNNFTVNNLTAVDQSTDTCTNNFSTLNSLANYYFSGTLSEGNLKVVSSASVESYLTNTIGVSTGKWYWEIKVTSSGSNRDFIGITDKIATASNFTPYSGNSKVLSYYGYTGQSIAGSTGSTYGASFTTGNIIGVAMDLDNNKLYFSKDGVFQNSGDPTSGSTGTGALAIDASPADGVYYAQFANIHNTASTFEANFGSPSFTISSGNTDGNGYGNFEYAVPSGYYALNSKNLAEFG